MAGGSQVVMLTVRPLLPLALACPPTLQLYSPGLLVALAVPDFSMPYNVITLTSTVFAVFLGATVNALLLRPGEVEREACANTAERAAAARRRRAKLIAVVVIFGALGIWLDPALQEAVSDAARSLGLLQAAQTQDGL